MEMIYVYMLKDKIIDNCGNKTMFLSILNAKGYNVPLGVVIDFEEFKTMVKNQGLDFDTINDLKIQDELIDEILNVIPNNRMLAIRSSANVEDGREINFSGKFNTFLNVPRDKEIIKEKIKQCFLSLYTESNINYYKKNNIGIESVQMNVIVQEMIESNVSGILFTVNPTNGKDTQIVIEFSRGAGDTVTGNVTPERIIYDWKEQKYLEEPKINLLGDTSIRRIINISLSLQQELGFPIDLEFGVFDSKLYIFQLRPITKIEYKNVYYNYSTNSNNFYSPLLLSMNSKAYADAFEKFSSIVNTVYSVDKYKPVSFSKFSRFYWNVDQIKNIYENIPGYVERYLDEKLKVKADYLDNGIQNFENRDKTLKIFSKDEKLLSILKKSISELEKNTEAISEDSMHNITSLVQKYTEFKQKEYFLRLVQLVFEMNLNSRYGQVLNKAELDSLSMGVEDKYSNAPKLYMWDVSRKIKKDKEAYKFFENNLDAEIYYLYIKDKENPQLKEFLTDFIDRYGYYFFDTKDVIFPTYEEEVLRIIKLFRDVLEQDDSYDPLANFKTENNKFEETLKTLSEEVKPQQYKVALKHIDYLRSIISLKFTINNYEHYALSLLRKELLNVGKGLKDNYFIDDENDVLYLEYADIMDSINPENIKTKTSINKIYYNSFRNYSPQEDIFPCEKQQMQIDYIKIIQGVGASFGKIRARACVINAVEDTKKFRKADIIVTKYIDSDILDSINVAQASGIVTELGGVLCHFAIKAREARIPCAVDVKDATKSIRSGEIITLNGDTGEVII